MRIVRNGAVQSRVISAGPAAVDLGVGRDDLPARRIEDSAAAVRRGAVPIQSCSPVQPRRRACRHRRRCEAASVPTSRSRCGRRRRHRRSSATARAKRRTASEKLGPVRRRDSCASNAAGGLAAHRFPAQRQRLAASPGRLRARPSRAASSHSVSVRNERPMARARDLDRASGALRRGPRSSTLVDGQRQPLARDRDTGACSCRRPRHRSPGHRRRCWSAPRPSARCGR